MCKQQAEFNKEAFPGADAVLFAREAILGEIFLVTVHMRKGGLLRPSLCVTVGNKYIFIYTRFSVTTSKKKSDIAPGSSNL